MKLRWVNEDIEKDVVKVKIFGFWFLVRLLNSVLFFLLRKKNKNIYILLYLEIKG